MPLREAAPPKRIDGVQEVLRRGGVAGQDDRQSAISTTACVRVEVLGPPETFSGEAAVAVADAVASEDSADG